jgi:hypothetical protein
LFLCVAGVYIYMCVCYAWLSVCERGAHLIPVFRLEYHARLMGDTLLLAEERATWPSALLSPTLLASVFDRLCLDHVAAPLDAGTAWA